jgi:anti-sigma regulatory factor (Ser/Thr protein kinase)
MRCVTGKKVIRVTAAHQVLSEQAWHGWRLGRRPGAEHCARAFAGVSAQVPEARAFVARALAGCPAREALMLCVTELAANAIEHTASGAGGVFTVEVARPADGVAYVAVTDAGGGDWTVPGLNRPAVAATDVVELAEGGRGLALVAACSNRWGYGKASGSASGRTVWAEATWPVAVGAGYTPKQDIWHDIDVQAAPGDGAA